LTVAYTPKDAVLDVVAIALILAPEPLTTPIGISLLLRKRGDGANEMAHPVRVYPEYVYKVDTIRGREITWEVRTIQIGQLPLMELNKPATVNGSGIGVQPLGIATEVCDSWEVPPGPTLWVTTSIFTWSPTVYCSLPGITLTV